jgi:hypothetical protein
LRVAARLLNGRAILFFQLRNPSGGLAVTFTERPWCLFITHLLSILSDMKLPKTLLGAILVGITVQAAGCKKETPAPKGEEKNGKEVVKAPDNCPACGMG